MDEAAGERAPLLDNKPLDPLDRLSRDVSALLATVAEVERHAKDIGTPADSKDNRYKLSVKREEGSKLATHIVGISKSGRYTGADFVRQEMIFTQRDAALQRWRQALKLAQERERSYATVAPDSGTAWREPGQPQTQAQDVRLVAVEGVDDEMVAETNKDLKHIESELNALRGVVGDINVMVAQQGEQIDTAETQTETAAANIETGTEALKKGEELQNSARKKYLCIALLVLLIVGALVVMFVVLKVVKLL